MRFTRTTMVWLGALLMLGAMTLAVGIGSGAEAASTNTSALADPTLIPLNTTGGCTTDSAGERHCDYAFNPGPRVNCGGYNGHVEWEDDWSGTIWIFTYGVLWSTCDTTTYLYLSFEQNMGLRHFNQLAGTAGPWHSVGVNQNPDPSVAESIGGVSNVAVTVCSNYGGGWHCGKPYHV